MYAQNDADFTASELAQFGVMPTHGHLAAMSSDRARRQIVAFARLSETPLHLELGMQDLRVHIVQHGEHWCVLIHSKTYCHVDSATFPLTAKMETLISYLEMRYDW